jgi:hypothetical protein|tara:strand:+ start:242 stop:394 length:153 start_codon:yes stop_codon:yes gene_type:complete
MHSLESLRAFRLAAGGDEAEDQMFQDFIDEAKQGGASDWDIADLFFGKTW